MIEQIEEYLDEYGKHLDVEFLYEIILDIEEELGKQYRGD